MRKSETVQQYRIDCRQVGARKWSQWRLTTSPEGSRVLIEREQQRLRETYDDTGPKMEYRVMVRTVTTTPWRAAK